VQKGEFLAEEFGKSGVINKNEDLNISQERAYLLGFIHQGLSAWTALNNYNSTFILNESSCHFDVTVGIP
jgi:hypothetical protein